MRRQIALAAWLVLLCIVPSSGQQPVATFRAGVDLITVETSVLDREGRPVTDLRPEDFTVTVEGTPRKVLFARFAGAERARTTDTTVAIAPGGVARTVTSAGAIPGHIVVFVVDRDSIKSGNEKALLETGGALIERLGPNDAVGLVGIPGPAIDLTREHARIREGLEMMTGTLPRQVTWQDTNVSWAEALAYENEDARTIAEVVERECKKQSAAAAAAGLVEHCPDDLRNQARELLNTGRFHVQTTMTIFTKLAEQLAPLRGTKTVIFLSGGLPFGQDLLPYFNEFARQAAAAHITFYAVHLDQPASDTSDRKVVASGFGGRDLSAGLTTMAGMTGGGFFNGIGTAAGVFDRITTEISNVYELGIETLPEDLSGKPRGISVKVNRPGLSVRAREQVVLPDRATATARLADPIKSLLAQPTDIGEVPISIAAYTTRGDEASTLRVMLSGEIGNAQTKGPAEWGFLVINEGNVVANGRARTDAAKPAPWAVTTSTKLTPGRYRLRVVASDADGRAGVADVPLTVGLRAAGDLQVSDLIVGTADGGRLQPKSEVAHGIDAHALIEIYSNDPARLEKTTAVLEVIPAGSAEPVQRYLMARRSSPISGAILIAEGDFATASLAPGRYTASVVTLVDEQPVGRVSRVFEVK